MNVIKIKFADIPNEFSEKDNFIVSLLQQRFKIEFTENPEFLFYSNFGNSFLKYKNCVRIFFSGEPVAANFNDCDYAIDYCRLNFGNRHFRAANFLGNMGQPIDEKIQNRSEVTRALLDRNFCNFVYSNERNGRGARLRKEFCQQLMKYKNIDCPGRVLNNIRYNTIIKERYEQTKTFEYKVMDESWADTKIEFLKKYKFTIAFENTAMNGFATEKIFHPIKALSVPIYWGDPGIIKDFNSRAFINCAEYDNNFEKIIKRIIELDNDEEQYLEMLKQPPINNRDIFNEKERLLEYLTMIINNGNRAFEKNALGFMDISATSFEEQCRLGNIGMRTIMKAGINWLKYKVGTK